VPERPASHAIRPQRFQRCHSRRRGNDGQWSRKRRVARLEACQLPTPHTPARPANVETRGVGQALRLWIAFTPSNGAGGCVPRRWPRLTRIDFRWGRAHPDKVKVREIVRMLKDDGGLLVRTRGSHHQYKHPTKPGLVTIAGNDNDELAPGTLNSILKQAGLKP